MENLCLRFLTGEDHRYIQPYRGFLLQLIPVGCSPDTPVILSDLAYLVEHNESQATYRCRSGLEFPGGQGDTVTLTCSGHQYDRPLPQCVAKIDSGLDKIISHWSLSIEILRYLTMLAPRIMP